MKVESLVFQTIRKPLVRNVDLFDCCVLSVKKFRLCTSNRHDLYILTLHEPIRLQREKQNAILRVVIYDNTNPSTTHTPLPVSVVSHMSIIQLHRKNKIISIHRQFYIFLFDHHGAVDYKC